MDWFVLGIEPTKDKKAITAAYRRKLRQTNPEDKPEEFKALRAAYEQALALADQAEEAQPDTSPVGRWMAEVEAMYRDYARRIQPENWAALVRSDICLGLDTRAAAEEALLKFLMEFFFLPQPVWQVLDEAFRFSQRVEELYESWPREFVDHAILSGIRLEPSLPYELFTPGVSGADCDAYRRMYFQAAQSPLEELLPLLEQMNVLSERHPYGDVLDCRVKMEQGDPAGRERLAELAQEYPGDPHIGLLWAEVCLEGGEDQEAERMAGLILDAHPGHQGATNIRARCLAARGQYHDAKELAYEIMHRSGSDPIVMEQLGEQIKKWNEALIRQREERYAADPADMDNMIELCWCYAQNERVDDAVAMSKNIDEATADPFDYHNLMGKLSHNTERFEEALAHLGVVEALIRGMTDDGTEKTAKRLRRLPEMLQVQGNCLMQLGRTEEARAKFEQALEAAPDDPEVLMLMGKILYSSGDFGYAAEMLERLLHVTPGAWYAEVLLALSLYMLRRDREAFDAVNRAMASQCNDLSLYILKMQILLRNGVFEEVHEILKQLKEGNAPADIATDFVAAQLTELEKKDEKKALKQYKALADRVEKGEILLWASELYYRLAVLTGNGLDVGRADHRDTVLAIIDKGLKYRSDDPDCLAYKAWVLKRGGLLREAIDMYKALEQKNPESTVARRGLADLYYEDLNRHAADALHYYELLLQDQKTAELYFYAATCCRHMGDAEGARVYYLRELEMDPDDIDGYRGLAFLCDGRGELKKSMEYIDQALAIMKSYGNGYRWIIEHKVKLLRRMGRVEEALAFVDDAVTGFGFEGGNQMKFDICCQFGLWDRAKQVLEAWKRANRGDPDLMAANGRLHLLQGKLFQAALAMGPAKHKLPYDQVEDFRLSLADLECNFERQIQIWSARVKRNPEDDFALTNLAQAYWYAGKQDAARGAAQKAVEVIDGILAGHLTDEALYRSRRCLSLAILGRVEEAKAELAKARALPLCDFCEYGGCKDADIYEAAIEEILGNREEARKLYHAGRANWPDDLDFASGEARLGRKGKR